MTLAMGDSYPGGIVADFFLSLFATEKFGGFDVGNITVLDQPVVNDIAEIITLIGLSLDGHPPDWLIAATEVEAIVAQMDEADRRYVTALAELRRAAQLTQHDLGTAMGIPQGKVSRIEHGDDMLLSTFTRYLAAVGEHPRVVVTIGGHDVELDLSDARE